MAGHTTHLQDKLLGTNPLALGFLSYQKEHYTKINQHLMVQQCSISYGTLDPDKARILFLLHFHISSDTHISTLTVSVSCRSWITPFFPHSRLGQDSASYLNSEFPHGANGDARDWSIVVGGHDGAFLGAPHTRHALGREQHQPRAQRNKHSSK